MSEKIQLHRRGFLANILKGAAVASVAAGTVIEVTETKAGATVVKEVEQETGEISFFNPKKWKSWDSLLEKLRDNPSELTEYEIFQISQYMVRSNNATKILITYSLLQKNQRALIKIHPLVNNIIVFIATGKNIPNRYQNMPHGTTSRGGELVSAENRLEMRDYVPDERYPYNYGLTND